MKTALTLLGGSIAGLAIGVFLGFHYAHSIGMFLREHDSSSARFVCDFQNGNMETIQIDFANRRVREGYGRAAASATIQPPYVIWSTGTMDYYLKLNTQTGDLLAFNLRESVDSQVGTCR